MSYFNKLIVVTHALLQMIFGISMLPAIWLLCVAARQLGTIGDYIGEVGKENGKRLAIHITAKRDLLRDIESVTNEDLEKMVDNSIEITINTWSWLLTEDELRLMKQKIKYHFEMSYQRVA